MQDTASPKTDPLEAFRPLEPDFAPSPEHEAWMQGEIRKTLAAKADGRMTYRSLDEAVRRFMPDAR